MPSVKHTAALAPCCSFLACSSFHLFSPFPASALVASRRSSSPGLPGHRPRRRRRSSQLQPSFPIGPPAPQHTALSRPHLISRSRPRPPPPWQRERRRSSSSASKPPPRHLRRCVISAQAQRSVTSVTARLTRRSSIVFLACCVLSSRPMPSRPSLSAPSKTLRMPSVGENRYAAAKYVYPSPTHTLSPHLS